MENKIVFIPIVDQKDTSKPENFIGSFYPVSQNESDEKHNMQIVSANVSEKAIFLLAKAFLSISEMTNKKLQKMCYYAKAWYLALYDTNLIEEQFEAWVHGAVQPELYHRYKNYGYNYIPHVENTKDIPEEYLSFAKDIYEAYGDLSGDELEKINHTEDPWLNARTGLRPWEGCNRVISENDMKIFYRKMMNEDAQYSEIEEGEN